MSRSSHVDSNTFSIGASRLAKALNRLIETPPAVETEMVSEESVALKAHLEAHDDYLDHCSGVNEPGDGSGE